MRRVGEKKAPSCDLTSSPKSYLETSVRVPARAPPDSRPPRSRYKSAATALSRSEAPRTRRDAYGKRRRSIADHCLRTSNLPSFVVVTNTTRAWQFGFQAIKGRLRSKNLLRTASFLPLGFQEMKPRQALIGSYSFAFCCLRRPRNFILALCNCDLEVPTEQPSILAISSCSCPSIS